MLPADTPAKHVDIPPPGTGPYKWTEYKPTSLMKVERNTFFKEWSKDAQPDRLADAIEQRFGLSVQAEVTQVENGQADYISNVDQLSAVPIPDPDLRDARERVVLGGDVPSPIDPPAGCRFHPRCRYATEVCGRVEPPLVDYGGGHSAACHHPLNVDGATRARVEAAALERRG